MNILALQTGQFGHLNCAVKEVMARYPDAKLTGLIKADDLERAKDSKLFQELVPVTDKPDGKIVDALRAVRFDYCLVPFDDRFGIQYWTFRSIPIRLGIGRIAAYNKRRRFRETSVASWCVETIVVNTVVRATFSLLCLGRCTWWRVRRKVSIGGVFVLAGLALCVSGLASLGLHPLKRSIEKKLPVGRRRLVLHIPSLGLGGAQRQLAVFLAGIDRGQWDVEVVTIDAEDKFFEPIIRDLDVSIHRLSPYCQLYEVGIVWQLVRYLYRKPCHVLHSWLHFAVALGAIAGTLAGIATIIGSIRSERPGRFPWFYPRWQRAIDVLTAPLQTLVIANSNAVRREHREWALLPDRKMVTIYNGIDPRHVNLCGPKERGRIREEINCPGGVPVVGIVGRLSPEKDHRTFLMAARLIRHKIPTARFVIVGDGPLRDWIRGETVALGLEGCVVMAGERRDVFSLIQVMDVFVLTSKSEGFPNVLLEAAVAGVPVVTTDAGGASEVIIDGETGFVVPCGDSQKVADRVLELLHDEASRHRFSDAGRRRLDTLFTAKSFVKAVQNCYQACCIRRYPRRTDWESEVSGTHPPTA